MGECENAPLATGRPSSEAAAKPASAVDSSTLQPLPRPGDDEIDSGLFGPSVDETEAFRRDFEALL